jgi:PAS domain S-box-containing protein
MEGPSTIDPQAAPEARLLAMAPDLLGSVGFDGLIQLVNPAWTTTLGWAGDRLRGSAYLDLVDPEDRDRAAATFEGLLAGDGEEQTAEFVCRMLHADGDRRSLLWHAHASRSNGCTYLSGKDVTDRQRLEHELARRAEKLESTNAELQDFAYIASHDLAEPLRMITSYLELLQRRYGDRLDETADEFIGYAVGGAERMKALIDDLLTYSRVGSHEMQRADIDLRELLAAVLLGIERVAADTRAEVELAEPLAPVRGDETQMSQLLQNLIVNAMKFHAPDRPPRVAVSSVGDQDGVTVSVRDNGIGIAPQQQDRIFKMFGRLHGRDEYDGTGIGLSVCRRIADRHGGRIWVESEPGAGSAFHVWLPR